MEFDQVDHSDSVFIMELNQHQVVFGRYMSPVLAISPYEPAITLGLVTLRPTTLERLHNTPELDYGKVQIEFPCRLTLSAIRCPRPPNA